MFWVNSFSKTILSTTFSCLGSCMQKSCLVIFPEPSLVLNSVPQTWSRFESEVPRLCPNPNPDHLDQILVRAPSMIHALFNFSYLDLITFVSTYLIKYSVISSPKSRCLSREMHKFKHVINIYTNWIVVWLVQVLSPQWPWA